MIETNDEFIYKQIFPTLIGHVLFNGSSTHHYAGDCAGYRSQRELCLVLRSKYLHDAFEKNNNNYPSMETIKSFIKTFNDNKHLLKAYVEKNILASPFSSHNDDTCCVRSLFLNYPLRIVPLEERKHIWDENGKHIIKYVEKAIISAYAPSSEVEVERLRVNGDSKYYMHIPLDKDKDINKYLEKCLTYL